MPKLFIFDAFTLLIRENTVANYALLRCKSFSLKIWVCKFFDKFHVWRYFSLTNQMVESSSNPTNRVHIISCVHYIVLMVISKKVTSAEGIYRKAVLCITTITFSRRLCLLCPVGKLVVQVALHIAMELVYKNCQRHKGSKYCTCS